MKDDEFTKQLEFILDTFYKIDREVKQYLEKRKPYIRKEDDQYRQFREEIPISDDKYKK